MKTKDLIAALQAADPSGELEVAVGNTDIHFVDKEPAYYDGCLQVLKRDPKKIDCYNIVGGEFRSNGNKIVIHTLSIKTALWDNSDLPVTFDADYAREHYAPKVDGWRQEVKTFEADKPNRMKRLAAIKG